MPMIWCCWPAPNCLSYAVNVCDQYATEYSVVLTLARLFVSFRHIINNRLPNLLDVPFILEGKELSIMKNGQIWVT